MNISKRAAVRLQQQRRCSKALQVQEGEDEWGRPLGVPRGLTAEELMPRKEYWIGRLSNTPALSTTDRTGRQALRSKGGGEPYFDTNPDTDDLVLDVTLASRVPFHNCNMDPIEVPVFNMQKQQVGTRKLDPYIWGRSPEADRLAQMYKYELRARTGYGGWHRHHRSTVPGPQGQLMSHFNLGKRGAWQSNFKNISVYGGGERYGDRTQKDMRHDKPAHLQSQFLRQSLTLKLMKERLIVLDGFEFPAPSVDLMRDWANSWGFDRDRFMAYIVDGGTAAAPSQQVHANNYWTNIFCYGLQVQEVRSLNGLDALRYHYLVVTEGALVQLDDFFRLEKAAALPPHLKKKVKIPLAELGEKEADWASVEEEAAYEVASIEEEQYGAGSGMRTLDDPWLNGKRWDRNEQRIKEHRKMVAEHLPRLGEPIDDDVHRYWNQQNVRLPETEELGPEYLLPRRRW